MYLKCIMNQKSLYLCNDNDKQILNNEEERKYTKYF